MYPYEANRADELTIQPGDVITVLYQDNENWWMGELADGRQGYFPSNYVMQQGNVAACHASVTQDQQRWYNSQMSSFVIN